MQRKISVQPISLKKFFFQVNDRLTRAQLKRKD